MKNIKIREENNTLGNHDGEWAIFNLSGFQYYGNDYNDQYVILINGSGKFIIGKKFQNCISIDSGIVTEYDSFADAENAIEKILN